MNANSAMPTVSQWTTPDYVSVVVSIAAFLVSGLSALYARRQSVAAAVGTAIQQAQHQQREIERTQARVEARFTLARDNGRKQLTLTNRGEAPASGLRLFVDYEPAEQSQFIWPSDKQLFPIGIMPAGSECNVGLFLVQALPPLLNLRLTWSDPSSSNREWSADLTTS